MEPSLPPLLPLPPATHVIMSSPPSSRSSFSSNSTAYSTQSTLSRASSTSAASASRPSSSRAHSSTSSRSSHSSQHPLLAAGVLTTLLATRHIRSFLQRRRAHIDPPHYEPQPKRSVAHVATPTPTPTATFTATSTTADASLRHRRATSPPRTPIKQVRRRVFARVQSDIAEPPHATARVHSAVTPKRAARRRRLSHWVRSKKSAGLADVCDL